MRARWEDLPAAARAWWGRSSPLSCRQDIFDPGFTTRGVGVGTGLGLSICHQIAQKHQGTLSVASRVGEGTTFTLSVPLEVPRVTGA